MQNKRLLKLLSCFLCVVLIAAIALTATGCKDSNETSTPTAAVDEGSVSSENVRGTGETKFYFSVTDAESKETVFEIHTNKKTVGEALLELNLIAGEQQSAGFYVKTVNGVTVDYDKDGRAQIFVGLREADEFFSPYSYLTYELMNEQVSSYIDMCESGIPISCF